MPRRYEGSTEDEAEDARGAIAERRVTLLARSAEGPVPRRFHIRAWGSDVHADLDYFSDDYPSGLAFKYPFIDVLCRRVIPLKLLKEHINGQEA